MMDKQELTEFEQQLLKEMNTRAMLIVKVEELLMHNKISINKEILYGLPDAKLLELAQTWDLENQERLRKKNLRVETGLEIDHTINGSERKDKVTQLTFADMRDLMQLKLGEIAMDYQFNPADPDYLGFLNCCPREEWSYNELYALSIFLGRERKIFDLLLQDFGLDIEPGADLDEIVFIERR